MIGQDQIRRKTSTNALKPNHIMNTQYGLPEKKKPLENIKQKDKTIKPRYVQMERLDDGNLQDSATILPKANLKLKSTNKRDDGRDLSQNKSHKALIMPTKMMNPHIKQANTVDKPQFATQQKIFRKPNTEDAGERATEQTLNEEQNTRRSKIDRDCEIDNFLCFQNIQTRTTEIVKPASPLKKRAFFNRNEVIEANVREQAPQMIMPSPQDPYLKSQIAQFQKEQPQINMSGQVESIFFLSNRHSCYQIDSRYIQRKQKRMNWSLRAIVIDWMAQICFEYKLKRDVIYQNMQTFHTAAILFDNYFEKTHNLPQSDFQVVGAAVIFIAAKLEEFQPLSCKKLSTATCGRYSPEQIRVAEQKICKALRYYLNPPTANLWANRMMLQWDIFLDQSGVLSTQPFFKETSPRYFKKFDINAYKHYRQVIQILDAMTLEIMTVEHKPQILVLAIMYLVLGKQHGEFTLKNITETFPSNSEYLFDENSGLNNVFDTFLTQSFGNDLIDIVPSIQYAATFFSLPITYYRPKLPDQIEVSAEDYCSYMTYNPNMLEVVNRRFRGIIL